jgi:hypothetical protein
MEEDLAMPETASGFVYPASTDHVRLWEHFQNLADSVDSVVGALGTVTSFTPTWNNVTQGSGAVNTGWYTRIGGLVYGGARLAFGTAPSFSTTITMDLPITANVDGIQEAFGSWIMRDTSALFHYAGSCGAWESGGISMSFAGCWTGTAPTSRMTVGVPITVAVDDVLSCSFHYRAA